jgi:hypothetical protein
VLIMMPGQYRPTMLPVFHFSSMKALYSQACFRNWV